MITGLDHIAIAVPDIQKAIVRFCQDLGLTISHQHTVHEADTETAFLPIDHSCIELVAAIEQQGPIQKFIEKRGGGLHHLCFRSDDLIADRDRLKAKGYIFIHNEPQPGAHGTQVLWIHPKSTEGVLIELAQHPLN